MAKTTLKLKVESINANGAQSAVRLIDEVKGPQTENGPQRAAKTVMQINFADSESALAFKVGSTKMITIE